MTTALAPIVTLKNGKAFANSRDVAEFFGKEHRNVLANISRLTSNGVLDFQQTPYVHPQNGQTYRSYDMTKDGFTLLAMGFTGAKALQFKLAYIAAFNELEAKVHPVAPSIPDFTNPVLAARAWADEVERKQCLQLENQRLLPLATIGERTVEHQHSLGRFARTLPGVHTLKIKADLRAHNYLYRRGGAYRVYSKFTHLFVERLDAEYGSVEIFPTPAGRALRIQMFDAGRLTMKKKQPTASAYVADFRQIA